MCQGECVWLLAVGLFVLHRLNDEQVSDSVCDDSVVFFFFKTPSIKERRPIHHIR